MRNLNNSLVSIIIPIYNAEEYIEECIKSIITQTYKNIEIILINDGSRDNSINICKEYLKKDKRIIIINQLNKGVSTARNSGITIAKGEYITFIDADDTIEKEHINHLVNTIKKTKTDLSICGIQRTYKKEKNISTNILTETIILDKKNTYKEMLLNQDISGYVWNKLYKKEILNQMKQNYFNESISIAEDYEFNC